MINVWLEALARDGAKVAVISHRFAEEYCCQPTPICSELCALSEEVYDYGSGCLCCTPGGELSMRLNGMETWGERYDRIIIRVGPVADPLLFSTAAARAGNFRVEGLVAVAEAEAAASGSLAVDAAARRQLEVADVVVLRSQDAEKLTRAKDALAAKASCNRFLAWEEVLSWSASKEGLAELLDCGHSREYPAVAPRPPALVGAPHSTAFKAVQFSEGAAVDAAQARHWISRLLARGICVRLKATLTLDASGRALLVDAARGKDALFREVGSIPTQVRFGEMEVLTSSTTVEASMEHTRTGSVLSRMFILLAPPMIDGLGDILLPVADELLEDFREAVDLTPVSQP